ncbi:MAG: magnesium transporter MgtE N-terminal domain-containing protein [Gemmatimonadaceae bacterium]
MIAEARLARAFLGSHPSRAAMALEQMPAVAAAAVLGDVPARTAAGVIREMTPLRAAACLSHLESDGAAAIVAESVADDAAPVVRALDAGIRDGLIAALPAATRDPLLRMLAFPEGTAGAVMDPSVFQVPGSIIVADARTRLRSAARDLLYYVYVIDEEHRLAGVLDIPELMLARSRDPVSAAMHRDVESISAWMPVALVRAHPGWHRFHAMPVVEADGRLLGAIRYQTLRRLERESADRSLDPSLLTARALGELFQLGATGVVAGVAAATAVTDRRDETQTSSAEVRDAG